MTEKVHKQLVKELKIHSCFFARDARRHKSARLNKGHAQFNSRPRFRNLSLVEECSKTYRTTHDEIFTVDLLG